MTVLKDQIVEFAELRPGFSLSDLLQHLQKTDKTRTKKAGWTAPVSNALKEMDGKELVRREIPGPRPQSVVVQYWRAQT